MNKIFYFFAAALFLTACSSNTKKIIVFSHDHPTIDKDGKSFSCKDTLGHNEQTVVYEDATALDIKISSKAGDGTISIPTNGYYIANLKHNDTIIGSYQSYSAPGEESKLITQVELKAKIDSLHLLMEGKNVSAANRNFFITPNTCAKITDNTDAVIVLPYNQLPAIETQNGKMPEIYKFYTTKELREIIANLEGLTK